MKYLGIDEEAIYSHDTIKSSMFSSTAETFVQDTTDAVIKTYSYNRFYVDSRWIALEETAELLKLPNIINIVFIKELDSEYSNDLSFYNYKETKLPL